MLYVINHLSNSIMTFQFFNPIINNFLLKINIPNDNTLESRQINKNQIFMSMHQFIALRIIKHFISFILFIQFFNDIFYFLHSLWWAEFSQCSTVKIRSKCLVKTRKFHFIPSKINNWRSWHLNVLVACWFSSFECLLSKSCDFFLLQNKILSFLEF